MTGRHTFLMLKLVAVGKGAGIRAVLGRSGNKSGELLKSVC